MRRLIPVACLSLACALAATPVRAVDVPPLTIAKDLLLPCQEADNDPRDGYIALLECSSYIRGFIAGLSQAQTPGLALCPPAANTDDALRRAFVAWVHHSFSKRSKMPVAEALRTALAENFACE